MYRWSLPVAFGAVKMEKVICRLGIICVFGIKCRVLYMHLMPKTQIMPNLQITFFIFTAPNTTGSDHLYNTLELLMMGIMVPETC